MSEGWIGAVVIGGLILAVATKPSEADFQAKADNAFATTRTETWNNGDIFGWAQTAVADYNRSGRYTDNIVMSEYELLVGGEVAVKCTGFFGSISCS